jgi:hydrogenase maturation protein HypF
MPGLISTTTERRRILAQGIVQGVGFRPFVYGLAKRWGLSGFVLNNSAGVTIEAEGAPAAIEGFVRALREETPPLARIDTLAVETVAPCQEKAFKIVQSQAGPERQALISPDMAICDDCLRELFDPGDRRYRYPFINCTHCGPRFTIIQDVPYDREKTTMRVFPTCPACQAEYDNPLNRRFHAQPNACPVCGPQVALLDREGQPVECADPILEAAQRLMAGAILAVKGIGGYHLACNALDAEAVQQLRQRKQREAKPFALMVPNLETARRLCFVGEDEAALLQSRRRPIVLLQQRSGNHIAPAVAPAYTTLGLMLPYAPLHYLLLDACAGVCEDRCPVALVMTSGNLSDEPIVYQDQEARETLQLLQQMGTIYTDELKQLHQSQIE